MNRRQGQCYLKHSDAHFPLRVFETWWRRGPQTVISLTYVPAPKLELGSAVHSYFHEQDPRRVQCTVKYNFGGRFLPRQCSFVGAVADTGLTD